MNPIFSRTLKALCAVVVAGVLTGCGSGSTVDPFKPTRVIGLGDAYNDTSSAYTVLNTNTVESVVGQVGVLFGISSVDSRAQSGASISDLTAQINAVGAFNASDLVVLTAGSREIREAYSAATFDETATNTAAEAAGVALADQVKALLRAGARHILIMQPLEFSLTPLAYSDRTKYPRNLDSSPTVKFNAKVAGELQTYVSSQGYSENPVIYGGLGLSSTFNTYVVNAYNGANTYFANLKDAKCGSATSLTGCSNLSSDDNYLFADGVNLTPAGNRWVAQYLYNATAQGWR